MTQSKQTAAIALAFGDAPPASVDAGMEFSFSAVVNWPEDASRKDATFLLREGKRTVHEGKLPGAAAERAVHLTLRAPEEVGQHDLTLLVASAEQSATRTEGTLDFKLTTVPHATSLAVWDAPSPVIRGSRFEIKAGAKCTSGCALAGKIIEIRDDEGKLMGSGALGETPLPGTAALSFTAISLKAPRKCALHSWRASFAASDLKLAHSDATASFSFVTVPEPEHLVSVRVLDTETKALVGGAQVRLGVYRAETDESGTAKVRVPKGRFPLVVTRPGYKMPERTVEVERDVRIRISAEKLPEVDPYALWTA